MRLRYYIRFSIQFTQAMGLCSILLLLDGEKVILSISTREVSTSSFRDPSGCVFRENGEIYRQVNLVYKPHYDWLFQSGLYQALIAKNLLIAHEEIELVKGDAPQTKSADDNRSSIYKICKPQKVPFISYPYEWCFSQLKDAALATLEIQSMALKHGMILKDSNAFNIQFVNGRPLLIDTLSFERYEPGKPWVAYRQFCQHFLAPLVLMSTVDVRLGSLSRNYIDGIPLDLACKLLPTLALIRPSVAIHLAIHANAHKSTITKLEPSGEQSGFSKDAMLGLVDSLKGAVEALKIAKIKSDWTGYYEDNNYTVAAQEEKQRIVSRLIDQTKPRMCWDFGANTGAFSEIAAAKGICTVSMDFDHNCVETNYLKSRESGQNLLPLVVDMSQPTPAIGWANAERQRLDQRGKADTILALALVHHLAIANNVPLDQIAAYFSKLGHWLIIEFITKEDSQVKRLLSSRKDVFADYSQAAFEASFSQYFSIVERSPIAASYRTIYLLESKA